MARRPDPAEFDRPLNRAELAERQRRLSMLLPHHVADAYRRAHEARRMEGQAAEGECGAGNRDGVQGVVGVEKEAARREGMTGPIFSRSVESPDDSHDPIVWFLQVVANLRSLSDPKIHWIEGLSDLGHPYPVRAVLRPESTQ